MEKPRRTGRNLGLAAALAVALVQFLFMVRCLGPGLVSSYPGIEYDGFDWVLQGLYLKAFFSGTASGVLPCLRDPVFILVTAADAWLGSTGIVVVAVLCLAHFLSLAALLSIWRRLGLSGAKQAALFTMAVLSPYAYFRGFILADPVAMAGMLVSCRLMLEWFLAGAGRAFLASGAVGLVAGLTQLYGLLPFLVGAGLGVVRDRRAGRRFWPRALFTAGVAALGALALGVWKAGIPHEKVPIQFELLRLSLDMAGFYANVWGWYLGFLTPVAGVLALAALRRRPKLSAGTGYLALTTAVFVGLLFFYHSEEARFSWYYFPLILCLAAAGIAWLDRVGWRKRAWGALAASTLVLAGQSLLVTPTDYWQPQVAQARVEPSETWLAMFLRAGPVDRWDLIGRCGAPGAWCEQARLPVHLEKDEQRILLKYFRLRLAQAREQGLDVKAGLLAAPGAPLDAAREGDDPVWVEDWR